MESASGGASTEGTSKQRKSRSVEIGSDDSEWSGDDDLMSSDGNDEGDDVERLGAKSPVVSSTATLLDGDFLEFTHGRPLPLTDRAKAVFHMSVLNVSNLSTLFAFYRHKLNMLFTFTVTGHAFSFHYQCVGLLHFGWH